MGFVCAPAHHARVLTVFFTAAGRKLSTSHYNGGQLYNARVVFSKESSVVLRSIMAIVVLLCSPQVCCAQGIVRAEILKRQNRNLL